METKYIVNNLSGQTIDGNITINGDLTITGTTNIRPYQVFTALLTQNGGDSVGSINFNNVFPLVVGVTYTIAGNLPLNQGGTDFTNVGAPNNNIGTYFIATGTTPIWGTDDGQLQFNEGAPVATVLENTIGNVWFTYITDGNYGINSNGLFIVNKCQIYIPNLGANNSDFTLILTVPDNQNIYYINTFGAPQTYTNGILYKTPIEIRIYY